MSKNMTDSSSRSGGCGCGGSSSTDCQCGKASCDSCKLEGFVRPRFFPGQLLTEEDLQLLDQYTVAKNRLHNRQFWGDGVVCGLKVRPHPCDKGKVLVGSGYALDCCGNDIVVACEQELDVNQMIRELKAKLKGGYDCGDPCGDKKRKDAAVTTTVTTRPTLNPNSNSGTGVMSAIFTGGNPATTNNDDTDVESVPTKFCLYVHYCETESDPVAPYATGDPCGVSGCEASRVREGFKFELRCDEEEKPRPSIKDGLCKCVRDKDDLNRKSSAVAYMQRTRERVSLPNDNNAQRLEEANKKLEAAVADWKIEKLDGALDAAVPVIVYTARTTTAVNPVQPLGAAVKGKRNAAAAAAAAALRNTPLGFVASLANNDEVKAALAKRSDLQRAEAEAILQKSALLSSGNADPAELSNLKSGLILTPQLTEASENLINEVRGKIALSRTRIPATKSALTSTRSSTLVSPGGQVSQMLSTYSSYETEIKNSLIECSCDAILPPCAPCEDQGVLLACIGMLDCNVVEICNMERRFVLTPVTMRYWFPEIDRAFETFEQLCCGRDEAVPGKSEQSWLATILAWYWGSLRRECVADEESRQQLAMLTGMTQQFPPTLADARRMDELEARLAKLEGKV
jgi:hypothetical protein